MPNRVVLVGIRRYGRMPLRRTGFVETKPTLVDGKDRSCLRPFPVTDFTSESYFLTRKYCCASVAGALYGLVAPATSA